MADCLVNPLKCVKDEGNSIRITDPTPPVAMVPISHAPGLEFRSIKTIKEAIRKCKKYCEARMKAIWCAGGVGKTTMVRRIEDRVRKEFDEVVTVVVSQQTDELKIQKQIAEILGLGLSEEDIKCLKDGNVPMIAIWGMGCLGKTTMVRRIADRLRKEFDELKIQKQMAEILGLGLSEETLAESISCLQQYVNLFLDIGRLNMSARYYKEIAELYEQEENLEQAIVYYEKPADLFQSEEVSTAANQLRDWNNIKRLLRFMIYEDIGRQSLNNNLLKYGVKGHLLASSARVMCCNQQCIRAIPGFGSNIFWNTRVQIAGRFSGCA